MLPPGLAFVALNECATKAMEKNTAVNDFYLDLRKYATSIAKGDTPFTPANTLIEALLTSLRMIKNETIEMVWKSHSDHG